MARFSFAVQKAALAKAIKRVTPCLQKNYYRAFLECIRVEFSPRLCLVATDGHILGMQEIAPSEAEVEDGAAPLNITWQGVADLKKQVQEASGWMRFQVKDEELRLQKPRESAPIALYSGWYPGLDHVFPQDPAKTVEVNPANLLWATKQVVAESYTPRERRSLRTKLRVILCGDSSVAVLRPTTPEDSRGSVWCQVDSRLLVRWLGGLGRTPIHLTFYQSPFLTAHTLDGFRGVLAGLSVR